MVYEYRCQKCDFIFDVVKSVRDFDRVEHCSKCNEIAKRQFSPRVHFIGAKVESAEYNPAFGCIVKNKKHRDELAKQKGLIEVGNEKVDSIHKKFDSERKSKRKKSWEEV